MAKITFSKARWMQDGDGAWLCIQTPKARDVCDAVRPDKTYDMEVKQHRERRSLDANAYAWVLIDKLAKATGQSKTHVYREAIREIGGNTETVCVKQDASDKLCAAWTKNGLGWLAEKMPSKLPGCVNVVLYYGSSTFDTAQMARFIDGIIQDCKAVGVETLPPDKLEAMLEGWT